MLLEQSPQQLGCDAHQGDGQQQTKDEDDGLLLCRARYSQYGPASGVPQHLVRCMLILRFRAQLAPHLPADPQEKNSTGEQKPKYLQQLYRYAGEYDSQSGRSKNSYDDYPPALLRRQTGSSKGNNDRIVSSQYQVDHNDLY